MNKNKVIDYLAEDIEIPSQKYALISIVGPNMPQKCDVWGLKIRGVVDSLESAKGMTKRIMKYDNSYDIFTVDIGKFFPLRVDPYDVKDVEYENTQLNELMKGYLENRETANLHFEQRKREMMQQAIKEGQKEGQAELAEKPEHPISILQKKQNIESQLKSLNDEIELYKNQLHNLHDTYNGYSQEEREKAEEEFVKLSQLKEEKVQDKVEERKVEDIRLEIMNELQQESQQQEQEQPQEQQQKSHLGSVLEELKSIEDEMMKMKYINNDKYIQLKERYDELKLKLNDKNSVNEYIKKEFVNPTDFFS